MNNEIFRNIRIEKGLSLQTVAKDIVSISSLSRFETGKIDLPFNTVPALLERLGMTLSEYIAMSEANLDLDKDFENNLEVAYSENNSALLAKMCHSSLSEYRKSKSISKLFDAAAAANFYIDLCPNHSLLKHTDVTKLARVLSSVETWTRKDLIHFGNTTALLPTRELCSVSTIICADLSLMETQSFTLYSFAWQSLLNALLTLILRDEPNVLSAANQLSLQLHKQDIPQHMISTRLRLSFFTNLLRMRSGSTDSTKKADALIAALRFSDLEDIADEFAYANNQVMSLIKSDKHM